MVYDNTMENMELQLGTSLPMIKKEILISK